MILFQPIFIWYVFIGIACIQFIYLWIVYSRIAFYKERKISKAPFKSVSVVICAKNEYLNLKELLPSVLTQDYPNYEVLVVNDESTDDTEFLIKTMQMEYPHLKLINVANSIRFFKGKKFPLSVGIKSAKNDWILLTDADCYPKTNQWIKNMVSGFDSGKDIVLGYGGYNQEKGLINFIVRYEALRVAMQYFSYALMGVPYMGIGRNLAYKKETFFKEKGFISHYNVSSGDDDLFINQAANSKNTCIVINPESTTLSHPKNTFSLWFQQKRRHFSTAKHYKFVHQLLLALWEFSTIAFYVFFILSLVFQLEIWISIGILILRLASFLLITKKTMNLFGEKKLLLISPIIELFLSLTYPFIYASNLINKKTKWK